MSVFHQRYSKQFIWKRAEHRANSNGSNGNNEEEEEGEASNDTETVNQHKTYLERVSLSFKQFCGTFSNTIFKQHSLNPTDSSRNWPIHCSE